MSDTTEQLDVVDLETLPRTTSKAKAATGQLGLNLLFGDGQASWQALHRHRQGLTMTLSGGQITQHEDRLSAG